MSNARKWIGWIQIGALALVVAAIVGEALLQDRYPGAFAVVESAFVIVVVGVVGLGILGLGWQALADLKRNPTEGVTGPVELSLQAPRAGLWAAVVVLVLGGIAAATWYFTRSGSEPGFAPVAEWELPFQWMGGLLVLAWAVALLGCLSMALRRAPWFVLTPRGFLYAPGGVSPGFVRWEDVAGLRETEIVSDRRGQGARPEGVLAVGLRDPSKYRARYNPLLAALARLGGKLHEAQTGGAADILINPVDFGDRYGEIKARMEALHAQARR
jgi:hypothetical protein